MSLFLYWHTFAYWLVSQCILDEHILASNISMLLSRIVCVLKKFHWPLKKVGCNHLQGQLHVRHLLLLEFGSFSFLPQKNATLACSGNIGGLFHLFGRYRPFGSVWFLILILYAFCCIFWSLVWNTSEPQDAFNEKHGHVLWVFCFPRMTWEVAKSFLYCHDLGGSKKKIIPLGWLRSRCNWSSSLVSLYLFGTLCHLTSGVFPVFFGGVWWRGGFFGEKKGPKVKRERIGKGVGELTIFR